MSKRFLGLLVCVACVGLLAACGGDGGEETTEAAEPLTKAEFIAQGDEICAEGDKEAEERADEFAEENDIDTENPSQEQTEEAVSEALVPSLRKQAEGLSGLDAPEGQEEEVEAIVVALEEATEEIEADPEVVFSGDANPLEEAAKLAQEFGFKSCGTSAGG